MKSASVAACFFDWLESQVMGWNTCSDTYGARQDYGMYFLDVTLKQSFGVYPKGTTFPRAMIDLDDDSECTITLFDHQSITHKFKLTLSVTPA